MKNAAGESLMCHLCPIIIIIIIVIVTVVIIVVPFGTEWAWPGPVHSA